MWSLTERVADRFLGPFVRAVSDVTVGTVIVLVHVALADRNRSRVRPLPGPRTLPS